MKEFLISLLLFLLLMLCYWVRGDDSQVHSVIIRNGIIYIDGVAAPQRSTGTPRLPHYGETNLP